MPTTPNRLVCFETLERRALFTGVTIVTHGFGGSADDWVATMGNLIAQQSGPLAQQPRYRMTATDSGNGTPIVVTSARVAGAPALAEAASREVVVLLDWSALAGSLFGGHWRTTQDVGSAVAGKLLGAFSIPDLARPLAELPIHLLGHSRGASLVSEIARGLGQRGAWVDQVTYFDPHPVDGVREPFLGPNYGDAAMRVYDNVVFADNYWRTDGSGSYDFTGEPVTGAHNLQLTESVLSNDGYSNDHSDTHLFYHGTIGPVGGPFQNGDGADGGGTSVGPDWYAAPHPARDATGWRYARVAASGTRPAAGSKFAGAPRDALTLTASGANVWDNVQINGMLADFTLVQGQPITAAVQFADVNDDATVTLGLDRDDDPYNGVFAGAGGAGATAFATADVAGDAAFAQIPTDGIAGGFRVYARIGNGTNARYYYAPGRATVTAAGFDKTWTGPARGAWSVAGNWSGGAVPQPGERVAIYDSAVTLAANAHVGALHLNAGASLDLRDRNLVIDYAAGASPLDIVHGYLSDGYHEGGWDGAAGIVSSVAATKGGVTGLAVAEAAAVLDFGPSGGAGGETLPWQGMTTDASAVLVRYTYGGDSTFDGKLDADDYGTIDFNVLVPGSRGYVDGDFNYDGVIDADDYGIIDFAILAQTTPF